MPSSSKREGWTEPCSCGSSLPETAAMYVADAPSVDRHWKRIEWLSADQRSPLSKRLRFVIRWASPPDDETTQMCRSSAMPRLDSNAIHLPSGEYTGSSSSPVPKVSSVGFPPAAGMVQILSQCVSCRTTASVRLSGDHAAVLIAHAPPGSFFATRTSLAAPPPLPVFGS